MIDLVVICGLVTFVLCIGAYIGMSFTERYVWRTYGIDLRSDPPPHRALARVQAPRSLP